MQPNKQQTICLSAKGLTKVFGLGRHKTVAVDHVDLDLYEGEVVSIVGESGVGKTTLAKMLLGLINETERQIYFQDKKHNRMHSIHTYKPTNTLPLLFLHLT